MEDLFSNFVNTFDNESTTDLEYFDKTLLLDNIHIIHEDINGKLIYIDYFTLIKLFKIENWDKNSLSDINKVNIITDYYKSNDIQLIPGIIYLWERNNNYYLYDGLHRFKAIQYLNKNVKLMIYINTTQDEEKIIQEFKNLKQSISLPSMYIDKTDLIKKSVCNYLADALCRNYSKFISTTTKHHPCNFNRNVLIQLFSLLQIDFNIPEIEMIIFKYLLELNLEAHNYLIENHIKYPKKCDKYNFYLFYLNKDYIKRQIEMYIHNKFA